MKLILEFTIECGIEYFDQVRGVEFSSKEEFIISFEDHLVKGCDKLNENKASYIEGSFYLAGKEWYYSWFVFNTQLGYNYFLPSVYTVDEWFTKELEDDA